MRIGQLGTFKKRTVNSAKFRNYHHLSATLCFNLEAEQIFILAVKYLELCSDVHCMNLSQERRNICQRCKLFCKTNP